MCARHRHLSPHRSSGFAFLELFQIEDGFLLTFVVHNGGSSGQNTQNSDDGHSRNGTSGPSIVVVIVVIILVVILREPEARS